MRRHLAALGLGGLALACSAPVAGPPFSVGDLEFRRLELSAQHVVWWNELSECSGAERDLSGLNFYEVIAPLTPSQQQFPCYDTGRLCSGVWEPPTDIYIASGMVGSERTVKHEMLHALLPTPEHPPVFFRCTG